MGPGGICASKMMPGERVNTNIHSESLRRAPHMFVNHACKDCGFRCRRQVDTSWDTTCNVNMHMDALIRAALKQCRTPTGEGDMSTHGR